MSDLQLISSSKNDIYTKLLNLAAAEAYVSENTADFANIDFLRAGAFGYLTEAMAMIERDSAFHKTMIYNEQFLNTCSLPKSIYNFAKTYGISAIDATPASRYVYLTLNTRDIDDAINRISGNETIKAYQTKYGINEHGSFMVIDKSNTLICSDITFSLEHSIEIYKSGNGYIATYCKNEKNITTEFGDYSNVIIPVYYKTEGANQYLTLKVKMFQYKTIKTSKTITTNSFLDTKIHNFSYTGQLCGLSLVYKKGNESEVVDLKFSNLVSNSSTTKKLAYYSLVDDNQIEIKFVGNSVTGLPQAGGILDLELYVTEGSKGNISYTSESIFLIQQDDQKTIAVTSELDSAFLTTGLDQSSLEDLRTEIINKLSTRNTIVTTNDLNLWFKTQIHLLSDTCNSNISFIKEQDNILKRTYSAYLLLRDGLAIDGEKASASYVSDPVPTNTLDLVFTPTDIQAENAVYEIKPTNVFKYDYKNNSVSVLPSNADSTNEEGKTEFTYITPFYIKVRIAGETTNRYSNVTYFFLEPSDSTSISIVNAKDLSQASIIPTTCTLEKNGENYYLKFYITSNVDLSKSGLLTDATVSINNSPINLTYSNIVLESSDNESDDVYNAVITYNLGESSDVHINDTSAIPTITFSGTNITLREENSILLHLAGSDSDSSTSFDVNIETNDTLTAFCALGNIMNSDIDVTMSGTSINTIVLKSVPVVSHKWYTNADMNQEWFRKQLFIYINMLQENSSKLETNTFFNLKFKNCYGISKSYDTLATNLHLKLKIYLNEDVNNYRISSSSSKAEAVEALEDEIRDFIRVAVDSSNINNELKVSSIISVASEAYADYIHHIDFLGLNDTFKQYVKKIETKKEGIAYPMEHFCLDSRTINDDIVFEII